LAYKRGGSVEEEKAQNCAGSTVSYAAAMWEVAWRAVLDSWKKLSLQLGGGAVSEKGEEIGGNLP